MTALAVYGYVFALLIYHGVQRLSTHGILGGASMDLGLATDGIRGGASMEVVDLGLPTRTADLGGAPPIVTSPAVAVSPPSPPTAPRAAALWLASSRAGLVVRRACSPSRAWGRRCRSTSRWSWTSPRPSPRRLRCVRRHLASTSRSRPSFPRGGTASHASSSTPPRRLRPLAEIALPVLALSFVLQMTPVFHVVEDSCTSPACSPRAWPATRAAAAASRQGVPGWTPSA